jgi:hypothetical protein
MVKDYYLFRDSLFKFNCYTDEIPYPNTLFCCPTTGLFRLSCLILDSSEELFTSKVELFFMSRDSRRDSYWILVLICIF